MDWIKDFYLYQERWSGIYSRPIQEDHYQKIELIKDLGGIKPKNILELGAGGGQCAALTADLGHTVTAIDLSSLSIENAKILARSRPNMQVIHGDFYQVSFSSKFDLITYWDGFGIGTDEEQRLLLKRINNWLEFDGIALIDIYTPWYAQSTVGVKRQIKHGWREYNFDFEKSRWLDSWFLNQNPDFKVTQSLRCYSPADLILLLKETGLTLRKLIPGHGPLEDKQGWGATTLSKALSYVAVLVKTKTQ